MEHDLAWVRLLIGLHGTRARSEVNETVSGFVEMGAALQFTEDKLTNIMEAAQVSLPVIKHGSERSYPTSTICWHAQRSLGLCTGHGYGGLSAQTRPPALAGRGILAPLRAPKSEHVAGAHPHLAASMLLAVWHQHEGRMAHPVPQDNHILCVSLCAVDCTQGSGASRHAGGGWRQPGPCSNGTLSYYCHSSALDRCSLWVHRGCPWNPPFLLDSTLMYGRQHPCSCENTTGQWHLHPSLV